MHKISFFNVLAAAHHARAFDNKTGWKLDADGHVVMLNGNPVYIGADGKEGVIEHSTISRLNGEAKSHRERAEAAETKLKAFEGITDPAAAVAALDTLSKIDQKKLIDAGEVDKVRDEISKGFAAQIAERDKKITDQGGTINNMLLSNAFGNSEFVRNRIAVPAEMFQATFGKNFQIKDGKIIPHGPDGNPLYSKKSLGNVADFDEAIEMLVEGYAGKDAILKAGGQSGSGNDGRGGGNGSGRRVTRDEFSKLGAAEQAATAAAVGKGEVTIVD